MSVVVVTPADLHRVHEVNVTGALLAIQAIAPLMTAGESIVLVGSAAALTGHFPAAYTASKWALRGLAKAACLELGPRRWSRSCSASRPRSFPAPRSRSTAA